MQIFSRTFNFHSQKLEKKNCRENFRIMGTNEYELTSVGEYDIGRKLGSGSYSKVYQVTSRINGGIYAMKILDLQSNMDAYVKRHYKREAHLLSKIRHKNIIKLIHAIESSRYYFLVLELMPENLCDFVQSQKNGKLDEFFSKTLFTQLSSAVSYLHKRGMVHRDIKLENILIDSYSSHIKLTGEVY
jgi:serine/threonine protein kinase